MEKYCTLIKTAITLVLATILTSCASTPYSVSSIAGAGLPLTLTASDRISFNVEYITGLSYSPDGRFLAIYGGKTSYHDCYIIIWDLQKNKQQVRMTIPHDELFTVGSHPYFLWAPDSTWVSLGYSSGESDQEAGAHAHNKLVLRDPLTGNVINYPAASGRGISG